jgi:hypothetical protein
MLATEERSPTAPVTYAVEFPDGREQARGAGPRTLASEGQLQIHR